MANEHCSFKPEKPWCSKHSETIVVPPRSRASFIDFDNEIQQIYLAKPSQSTTSLFLRVLHNPDFTRSYYAAIERIPLALRVEHLTIGLAIDLREERRLVEIRIEFPPVSF